MLVGGVSVSFALTGSVLFYINSCSIIKKFWIDLKELWNEQQTSNYPSSVVLYTVHILYAHIGLGKQTIILNSLQ